MGEIEAWATKSASTVETRRVVSRSKALGESDADRSVGRNWGLERQLGELDVVSLELDRGEVAERGVPAPRVVPALDVLEDRGSGLGAHRPGLPVDPLLLQGRVEGLADGVVVAVADRAHRDLNPGLGAALSRTVLRCTGSPGPSDGSARARGDVGRAPSRALRRPALSAEWSAIDQPTISRENRSWTCARYRNPSHVEM